MPYTSGATWGVSPPIMYPCTPGSSPYPCYSQIHTSKEAQNEYRWTQSKTACALVLLVHWILELLDMYKIQSHHDATQVGRDLFMSKENYPAQKYLAWPRAWTNIWGVSQSYAKGWVLLSWLMDMSKIICDNHYSSHWNSHSQHWCARASWSIRLSEAQGATDHLHYSRGRHNCMHNDNAC